jgi:hypothetical protein
MRTILLTSLLLCGCVDGPESATVDDAYVLSLLMQSQLTYQVNQTAGDDAAGDATEVAAPPAAKPPKVVLYGYTGCEGCKWSHDQFTKEKIPHEYIIVKPVAGVEYPYAEVDGKKLSYLEIQDWLKSRKENP